MGENTELKEPLLSKGIDLLYEQIATKLISLVLHA
jgi:hypothetical protein